MANTKETIKAQRKALNDSFFKRWDGLMKRLADSPGFASGDPRNGSSGK